MDWGITMRCKLVVLFFFAAVLYYYDAVAHAQQWSGIIAPSRAIDWSIAITVSLGITRTLTRTPTTENLEDLYRLRSA